ncbi:MAG: ATPase [Candidatus Thorarchaeota archaeon]|nr:ATPase [Candidatus Thorarchaeota archaeon]
MQVKKRNGSLEAFMPEKIVVSSVKAGAPYDVAKEIASSFESRKENQLKSSAIRGHTLSELRSRGHESAAKSWETYEHEKQR